MASAPEYGLLLPESCISGTDALLSWPDGKPMEQRCGKCTEYTDICPVHASAGRPFNGDEPPETRSDAAAGDRYFKDFGAGGGSLVLRALPFCLPVRENEETASGRERTGMNKKRG
jgi:hypothetical protein